MTVPRWFALISGAVALLLLAAGMGFEVLASTDTIPGRPDAWLTILISLVMGAYPVVGALLVIRQPANRIGWLLLLIGLASGVTFGTEAYVLSHQPGDTGGVPGMALVAWLYGWVWITFPVGIVFTLLLFPNGRLASPRPKAIGWLITAGAVLTAGAAALRPGPLPEVPELDNPFGVPALAEAVPVAESIGLALFLITGVAACVSLLQRFHRSHGIERQQLKWFVAVGTLAIGSLAVAATPVLIFEEAEAEAMGLMPVAMGGWLLALLSFGLLPVAVAISVLRYRLYDIDLIIRRTLVYAGLSVSLAAVYVAGVLTLQAVMRPLTEGSSLAVAASTLVVAALFRPLRAKLQRAVDRRFYRSQYDAQRTLETFGARLRDEMDLDSLTEELREVVDRTMQPASTSVWVRR